MVSCERDGMVICCGQGMRAYRVGTCGIRIMTTERSRWIVCVFIDPGVLKTPGGFRRSCSPSVRKVGAFGPGLVWRGGELVAAGLFLGFGFVFGSESGVGVGVGPKSVAVGCGVGVVWVCGCLMASHLVVGDAGTIIRA